MMKYFLHDTRAFADEKITLLFMEFGYEGLGLFYTILERLAMQEKPIAEEVIKTQLYIKKKLQKQLDFMYKIDLLSLRNGDVFSETLLNFAEKYQIKKEKTRKKVAEWRAKQEDVTSYKPVTERLRNHRKVKESKVKLNGEYKNIVEYLNSTTGSKYKLSTKKTQDLIAARFGEGFTAGDFITVIDKKNKEWKDDPEMCKFLRPITLFGAKFESYLNQIEKDDDYQLPENWR